MYHMHINTVYPGYKKRITSIHNNANKFYKTNSKRKRKEKGEQVLLGNMHGTLKSNDTECISSSLSHIATDNA